MDTIESAGYTAKIIDNPEYPGIEIWYNGVRIVAVEKLPDDQRQIVVFDMHEDDPKHIVLIESEAGV
ncbi:hypothetical protein ACKI1K_43835 [Streptomyces scabiei]|uniref:hypothetical protein n=1 Tax=Bacteria TaxID=2 RepID=UPI0038541890